MISWVELEEAYRMFRRARKVKREGFRRFEGSPKEICRQIIDSCWDPSRHYFRVSSGHFTEFYVRDFAHSAEALVKLGYKKQVDDTIRYALEKFERHGQIEQSISPQGKPFSFPAYSPDALGLLLHVLAATGNDKLVKSHHGLLQREANRFSDTVVDPKTLLPKAGKQFSGMRDHAWRQASCYDAVMVALVAKYAPQFGLKFAYSHEAVVGRLLDIYWNGKYFFSDQRRQSIVTGDANVFPFWTGVLEGAIDHKRLSIMRAQAIASIHGAGLDNPWPLRYVSTKDAPAERVRLHIGNLFAGDYQTHSIWMNIGLCMLDVLWDVDPKAAQAHNKRIGELLTEYGTLLELYDKDGGPFRTPWYVADEAMLWCAQWLCRNK